MKRLFSFRALIGAVAAGVFASAGHAGVVPSIVFYDGNPLYVQSVVQSSDAGGAETGGPDTAYIVIDLASGPDVAWQYDFDNSSGPITAWQALNDIAAADGHLQISATFYPSFGNEWYVNNFQYGAVVGARNKWDFYTSSYNPADVSGSDLQGTTGWAGISAINTTDLTDGEILGGVDVYPSPPTPVLPETQAAVPEPASVWILLMGSGLLIRRRRR